MRLLHTLPTRFARDFQNIIEKLHMDAANITLRWDATAAELDVNEEPTTIPAVATKSEEVGAMVHFVSATTIVRQNLDFKAGDAIVTFGPNVDMGGKPGLHFILPNGKVYVQRSTGKEYEEFWDVVLAGQKLTKTLLLRMRSA